MNSFLNIDKIYIFVNIELLFDFRSFLFSSARLINDKYKLGKQFSQSFFNSLKFSNIDQFIESLKSEDQSSHSDNFNYLGNIKENIFSSRILENVKPRLLTFSDVYCITQMIPDKLELILFSNENYYIDITEKIGLIKLLKSIFNCQVTIEKFENYKKLIEQINDSNKKLAIIIDYDDIIQEEKIETLRNENLDVFIISKKFKKTDEEVSISDKFIDLLSKVGYINSDSKEKFQNFVNKEFIYKYSKEYLNYNFHFLSLWKNNSEINQIEITGNIISGLKRGSKLLGIPTANIELSKETLDILQSKINGIYYGEFKFNNEENKSKENKIFKGVLSIGYNPYFDNNFKTVEVFLIDYEGEDFYGSNGTLTIKGFIRTESSFENFGELVTAITYDIIISNQILSI